MNRIPVILFDATPLLGQKSGVGNYTRNLVTALAKQYPNDVKLVGYYFNFVGRKSIDIGFGLPNVIMRPIRFFPGIFLPLLARRLGFQIPIEFIVFRRYDLQLFTNFISLPTLRHTPQIVAVHDMGCFDHPEYVQSKNLVYLKRLLPRSVKRAARVITISQFTKDRIVSILQKSPNDIFITPIPPPPNVHKEVSLSPDLLSKGIKAGKYALYVGTVEPRKNLIALVESFNLLPGSLKKSYALVIAGGKGWKDENILSAINEAVRKGANIILTGYVSEDEKAALYQKAALFVLPSHYEGFGMPLLEAMSYGLPVAASDIPVFHEVAGSAALYFDKDSPENIAHVISQVLTDSKLRDYYRELGAERSKEYDWNKVAAEVFEQIKLMLG